MLTLLSQVNISDGFNSPFGKDRTIGDLVSLFLNGAFVLAGILVLVLFLVGGFSIIAGAGKSEPEAAQKGKNAISAAILGFVVIFAAYWIVRVIEVMTGSNFITQPGF